MNLDKYTALNAEGLWKQNSPLILKPL